MNDKLNLQRFVAAQEQEYETIVKELQGGLKRGHWMWYIFPQIVGLGMSATSKMYAIQSADEARAYYDHDILGVRLRECICLVNEIEGRTTREIFGYVDNLKFRSSMTLFSLATNEKIFRDTLVQHFEGEGDHLTIEILKSASE